MLVLPTDCSVMSDVDASSGSSASDAAVPVVLQRPSASSADGRLRKAMRIRFVPVEAKASASRCSADVGTSTSESIQASTTSMDTEADSVLIEVRGRVLRIEVPTEDYAGIMTAVTSCLRTPPWNILLLLDGNPVDETTVLFPAVRHRALEVKKQGFY